MKPLHVFLVLLIAAAVLLIVLLAVPVAAQQLLYVSPQPQPSPPVVVIVPQPSADVHIVAPVAPQLRNGIVSDPENRRFHYQETGPGAGSYWVYPMQSD